MANEEQLNILWQGVSVWNAWRQEHPKTKIDLSGTNLKGVDFRQANLTNANLNGTTLTNACLWETQRAGWSIQGVTCEAAYWDKDGHERTPYNSGEFERLYADKTIVLHYEGSANPILLGMLMPCIYKIGSAYPCYAFDLKSVECTSSSITITVVVESLDEANPSSFVEQLRELVRLLQYGSDFSGRDLSGIYLQEAAFLNGLGFRGANLSRANLSRANLSRADLSGADLTGANLTGANLTGANLTGANLKGVDFRQACLIGASLDGATLTNACLWETQRAGWSIQGILCEVVYWDRNRQEQTTYRPEEFERLYADTTKIVLHYEGGISPIEVATLPALIQRIEATHLGCVLRLHAVQDAPGGATVTLMIEEEGGQAPVEVQQVLQEQAKQLQAAQRYALEQVDMRQRFEYQLSQLKDDFFALLLEDRLKERALQAPAQTHHLTTLFLDMHGFSRLGEAERQQHMSMLRGFAQPLLQRGAAQYVNTWGDAIVACFVDANAGLRCACQLVTVLQAVGIQTRIGMSRGQTFVHGNPLIGRLDIEGDSVNFAARLEPLAELGEVLIAEELRYDQQVEQKLFIFTRHQRSLKKAVGDQKEGKIVACYSVKLAGESQN